jgi:hypothetical protein
VNEFNTTQNFNKKHLLLSTNFKQEKAGLCGSSAVLEVIAITNFSALIHSIPTHSTMRSKGGRKQMLSSENKNL